MQTQITTRANGIDTDPTQYLTDAQGNPLPPNYADLTGQCDFVFVKMTEGISGVLNGFPIIWSKLATPAPIRGIYHYQRSGVSWQQQADNLLKGIPTDCQIIALDIEKTNNVMDKTFFANSSRLLNYWKANSKCKVIYYINQDVYMNYMLPAMTSNYPSDTWYLDFPDWVASWPTFKPSRGPDLNPSLPTGIRGDWRFLQYNNSATRDHTRSMARLISMCSMGG